MSASASHGTAKRKTFFSSKDVVGFLFVTPLLTGLLVFHLYPIIQSFMMSLQNTNGVTGVYVGFSNYQWIFKDSQFWNSVYNTVYMTALSLILNVSVSFLLASLINSAGKTRNLFKSIYFLPNVVSTVAASILFTFLFYPSKSGVINSFLAIFGIKPLQWFSGTATSRLTICIMGAWRSAGYYMIIFIAGLQSVPTELYEAADVDGVTGIKKWWYITIPSVRPIFAFIIIMDTISSMRRFSDVYMVGGTGGNPGGTLATTVLFIYRNAFTGSQMGIASAAAFVLFLFIMILSGVNNLLINRPNDL